MALIATTVEPGHSFESVSGTGYADRGKIYLVAGTDSRETCKINRCNSGWVTIRYHGYRLFDMAGMQRILS